MADDKQPSSFWNGNYFTLLNALKAELQNRSRQDIIDELCKLTLEIHEIKHS